jgi:hypothetical protein
VSCVTVTLCVAFVLIPSALFVILSAFLVILSAAEDPRWGDMPLGRDPSLRFG